MARDLVLTSNRDTVARNFRAHDERMRRGLEAVIAKYGPLVYQRTFDLAPKDTWFMVENLRLEYSQFNFTVGWYRRDFVSAGKPFYPPYQEFGTSRNVAQPSLGPAMRMYRPKMREEIRRVMRGKKA